MSNAKRKQLAATAIRALIKSQGVERIYNNIYKTGTRTLKVYQSSLYVNKVDLIGLKDRIIDMADAFDFDVKFRETRGSWYSGPAFIVKL